MRRERAAGVGVLGLLGAALVLNVVWIGGHCAELRPFGPGDVAPTFALPRADGLGYGNLGALRGRVVVIDFWATWCGPCAESMPIVERLYAQHQAQGLEVLSVNIDGGRDPAGLARAYAKKMRLAVPIVVDDGHVAAEYKVTTIPHLVVVDRAGVIRFVELGVPSEAELRRIIQGLL